MCSAHTHTRIHSALHPHTLKQPSDLYDKHDIIAQTCRSWLQPSVMYLGSRQASSPTVSRTTPGHRNASCTGARKATVRTSNDNTVVLHAGTVMPTRRSSRTVPGDGRNGASHISLHSVSPRTVSRRGVRTTEPVRDTFVILCRTTHVSVPSMWSCPSHTAGQGRRHTS